MKILSTFVLKIVYVFSFAFIFNFSSIAFSIAEEQEPENLVYLDDSRSLSQTCIDGLIASLCEPLEVAQRFIHSYQIKTHEEILNPQQETQGLLVFVHGLNAKPIQFWSYLQDSESFKNWSLYTPAVLNKGQISLDEAVAPILHEVKEWGAAHQGLPIILIGTSNGGRIVLELSNKLSTNNPILLISLAGAIGGSGTLSLLESLNLGNFFASDIIREELMFNSDRAQKLIGDARARIVQGNIHYVFFGASEDHLLLDRSVPFPVLGSDMDYVRYIVLSRTGHSGIVTTAKPLVVELIKGWISSKTIHHF